MPPTVDPTPSRETDKPGAPAPPPGRAGRGASGPWGESGKGRAARIPLDYYKRLDTLALLKGGLTLAAVLIASGWVVVAGLGWGRADHSPGFASPGRLTRAHAAWDDACEACHVPFAPIDGSGWASRFVTNARAGDARCQSCHASAGHHALTRSDVEGSCASCHRDHRGRGASLLDVDDRSCTRCHAALSAHLKPGAAAATAPSVTGFDAAHHPELTPFRSPPAKDRGRLKFDHALHMARGFTLEPGGRPLKTLADLAPADRPFYQTPGAKDDDGVQLRCDSCHRTDPAVRGGASMRPIRYERDCRACHPLDYAPDRPPARHGDQPEAVHDALWNTSAARFVEGHPGLKEWRPSPRPIPGRDDRPETRAARKAIGDEVATAERVLFGPKRCGECHVYETPDGRAVEALTGWSAGRPVRVAATNVPEVWLAHAAFDHSAHKALGCRVCHSRADASRTSADVLLPTVAICQTCHAPRRRVAAGVTGGAGFACVECHRYHVDETPPALPSGGTPGRDASIESELRRFLLGHPHQGLKPSGRGS